MKSLTDSMLLTAAINSKALTPDEAAEKMLKGITDPKLIKIMEEMGTLYKESEAERNSTYADYNLNETHEQGIHYSTDGSNKIGFYGYAETIDTLREWVTEEELEEIDAMDDDAEFSWLNYMDKQEYDAVEAMCVINLVKPDILAKLGVDMDDVYEECYQGKIKVKSLWRDGYGDNWLVEYNG